MKRMCLTSVLFLLVTFLLHGQQVTINGYITDASTGEKLIGATIVCIDDGSFAVTNSFGYYAMKHNMAGKTIRLQASFVGYEQDTLDVIPDKDLKIDFELKSDIVIEGVTVKAPRPLSYDKEREMSTISVPISKITVLPALGGESDLLKSLQLLPGIQSGNEASSGLYVRGGSPDQNLMVIDDVPLYYVNHLGGFVSTFNSDAINSMKLIKGGFPARYGSRLSSVLDIRMKEGNFKEQHGNFMIGMIASKFMLEGPIKIDTTSYLISVRRLMYDLITRPLTYLSSSGVSVGYTFYDFNVKLNHYFSPEDRIYFSMYSGDDKILTKNKTGEDVNKMALKWGNILGSFRWNHIYGDRLFSNLTIYSTRYRLDNKFNYIMKSDDLNEESSFRYRSGIVDVTGKIDFEYNVNRSYTIKYGGAGIWHFFNPNSVLFNTIDDSTEPQSTQGSQKQKGFESGVYIENEISVGNRLFTNIGFRLSNYQTSNKNYFSAEPRVLSSLKLGTGTFVKVSFSTMNQYVHLLTGAGPTMQNDIWVPVTDQIAPSKSKQYAIGIEKTFGNGSFDASLEGYYKTLHNLITYKEGVSLLASSIDWQSQVETNGTGKSYGIEFLLQKKGGPVTGWIAYTYSKTTRKFENINYGRAFPFKYDRNHDISMVYLQRIKSNIQLSATWVYGTGNPFTLATGRYRMITGPEDNLDILGTSEGYGQIYGDLNSYRMRAYHKLDVGINFYKEVRWGERTLSFNVYNLYNRQNPYYYFLDVNAQYDSNNQEIPGSRKYVLKQQSYFPIIPSISYSIKF